MCHGAQTLQTRCASAANPDQSALHIGPVAFIHRFGSSLNEHVHFHVCVVDGVFEALAEPAAPGVVFHPSRGNIGHCAKPRASGPRRCIRSRASKHDSAASTPKRAVHCLWAVLIARIYEVFPLVCPICGGQMRIIATPDFEVGQRIRW